MSVESYAHKAAKSVVMQWLSTPRVGDIYDSALGMAWFGDWNIAPFWEEYPILSDKTGLRPVWMHYRNRGYEAGVPSYDQLFAQKTPPSAILDVAICDIDHIRYGIEIVHKNPPSAQKLKFLRNIGLPNLLVIPSRWILGQIEQPRECPSQFWAWAE